MHFAVTGNTAAEIIYNRANANKEHMGLTSWSDAPNGKIIKSDVVSALTESDNSRKYWSVLKLRLKKEGSELTTNCSQLKLKSSDGKYYNQDVFDTKGILRLIESVPSPKAEPFKLWLANLGSERIDEVFDPE